MASTFSVHSYEYDTKVNRKFNRLGKTIELYIFTRKLALTRKKELLFNSSGPGIFDVSGCELISKVLPFRNK